jgi:iron(III) transport system permease protein
VIPSFLAAFFIVFILSFGDLAATLLVVPPGKETAPIRIYNLMHYGADEMVSALSVLLIGLLFLVSGIFWAGYRKLAAYDRALG